MRKTLQTCIPAIGLLFAACAGEKKHSTDKATAKIPIVSVIEKDIHLDKVYVSDIQAIQNVEIRSRIPGFLERVHVDEGSFVKKGQLLFTLNDQEYKAEIAQSRAGLNSVIAEARTAELEQERVKLLVDKNIVSATELDVAKAKLRAMNARIEEAEARLSHAQTRLSYTRILAPYDGMIDRIPLKVGSLLEEGTLITSVSDISSVFVYFNISENEYLDYLRRKVNHPEEGNNAIRLILSDGKEYEFPGKVETVVSEFEESTGSIAFRARFPNPGYLLKHGATGKVKLSREIENALMLPQKAVFEIQDRNYVFVLDAANVVHLRHFKPRTRMEQFYVVESGLKEGERIVYEGIRNIKDGMRIVPRMISADSLLGRHTL